MLSTYLFISVLGEQKAGLLVLHVYDKALNGWDGVGIVTEVLHGRKKGKALKCTQPKHSPLLHLKENK